MFKTIIQNRKDVIEDLINTLKEKNIKPVSNDNEVQSIYTQVIRVKSFCSENKDEVIFT